MGDELLPLCCVWRGVVVCSLSGGGSECRGERERAVISRVLGTHPPHRDGFWFATMTSSGRLIVSLPLMGNDGIGRATPVAPLTLRISSISLLLGVSLCCYV
jgi:hypothetical protein